MLLHARAGSLPSSSWGWARPAPRPFNNIYATWVRQANPLPRGRRTKPFNDHAACVSDGLSLTLLPLCRSPHGGAQRSLKAGLADGSDLPHMPVVGTSADERFGIVTQTSLRVPLTRREARWRAGLVQTVGRVPRSLLGLHNGGVTIRSGGAEPRKCAPHGRDSTDPVRRE